MERGLARKKPRDETRTATPGAPALAAVVLAAGRSKRMLSALPKVLHPVLGVPIAAWVLEALADAGVRRVVVVTSQEGREPIATALATDRLDLSFAVQREPHGTADAVLSARPSLEGFRGTLLVLCGDAPCVSARSLEALLAEHRARRAHLSLLSGDVPDPHGYGRIVRGPDGDLSAIVEEKDATDHVRAIREINSGIWALEVPDAWDTLARVRPSEASGELYLTEAVAIARYAGLRTVAVRAAVHGDVLGVNDRADLAEVVRVLRRRVCDRHLANGVTIVDPDTAFIDPRATIGRDTTVLPFVVIEGPCSIGEGARVGPFAHVRGGSRIGSAGAVGNFVEVARSTLGERARALHLAYLGDATVGVGANVGCGTITANFDGERKHATTIGAYAHLGSGTVLIAPCEVGARARTGAGAVVTHGSSVPAGETWAGVPAKAIGEKARSSRAKKRARRGGARRAKR